MCSMAAGHAHDSQQRPAEGAANGVPGCGGCGGLCAAGEEQPDAGRAAGPDWPAGSLRLPPGTARPAQHVLEHAFTFWNVPMLQRRWDVSRSSRELGE